MVGNSFGSGYSANVFAGASREARPGVDPRRRLPPVTQHRPFAWLPGAVFGATVAAALAAAAPTPDAAPRGDGWKYDVVYPKTGDPIPGLVVEQDADHVFVRKIVRKPGAPTLVFSQYLKRG